MTSESRETGSPIFMMLRGAPGSGKSTWVAENGLEDLAVSSDAWRIELLGIEIDPKTGKESIPQRSVDVVWAKVREDIEDRMIAGEDVILDSCALKARDMLSYVDLCEEHGYFGYAVEFFHDVDRETAKERNLGREEYRQVPDYVIDRFYDLVDRHRVPGVYRIVSPREAKAIMLDRI